MTEDNNTKLEYLLEALKDTVAEITFTKKDGSTRIMTCTRDMSRIPSEQHPVGDKPANETTTTVYDLDSDGWRSFKNENLISYTIHITSEATL